MNAKKNSDNIKSFGGSIKQGLLNNCLSMQEDLLNNVFFGSTLN